MARIVLGVTGSVAAVRTPLLYDTLRADGHEVRIVATERSLYFFDPAELTPWESPGPVFRDSQEWMGPRYERNDLVLHIEFRRWAELLIVAPLDANTLAKFAQGLCDNFLTCVFRAWDFSRPVILAPAMNTLMWQNPITRRHLGQLAADFGAPGTSADGWSLDEVAAYFARQVPGIVLIPPQAKRLACGDVGVGAMAEVSIIAESVRAWSALTTEND